MRGVALTVSVLLLLTTPLATVSADATVVQPLDADIHLDTSTHLKISPDAGGWGMLRLVADVDMALQVDLVHDTFEDLGMFTRDGVGIYDDSTIQTFFYLYEPGNSPYSTDVWFEWWSDEGYAWWPDSGTISGAEIELDAGDELVLVAQNLVSGYTFTLQGAAPGPAETIAMALGDHPEMRLVHGETVEEARALNSGYQKLSADMSASGASIIKIAQWDWRSGGPAHADHTQQDCVGDPLSTDSTSTSIGAGMTASGSRTTWTFQSDDGIDLACIVESTEVGPALGNSGMGLDLTNIPLPSA